MDPTYPWSDSNPYKFQFLGPADEILEEVLEYEVRNYAEHEWDERGLITMTFVTEIGNEFTGERRFFAVLCCPGSVTFQKEHSFHASEATGEDDADQLCGYMADMMQTGDPAPRIPKHEAHLWN